MTDFKKTLIRHIIISLSISLVAALVCFFFFSKNGVYDTVITFFSSFGIMIIPAVITALTHKETDMSDFKTMYFYEGYSDCGVLRVYKLYGNPEDQKTIERTFNFLNKKGEFLFDEWFIDGTGMDDDTKMAIVMRDDFTWWVINSEGEYVTKKPYKFMAPEISGNTVKVMNEDNEVNFVDLSTGVELWDNWKKEL